MKLTLRLGWAAMSVVLIAALWAPSAQAATVGPSGTALTELEKATTPASTTYANNQVTQVSGGSGYMCGLRPGGQLACWGEYADPEYNRPAFESFRTIDVASYVLHGQGCGIRTVDDEIRCWRTDAPGVTQPLDGSFSQVSYRGQNVCGIRPNGDIACATGHNNGNSGLTRNVPSGPHTSIAVDSFGACALSTAGTVACWGGTVSEFNVPPPGQFVQVATSGNWGCALDANQDVSCWGPSHAILSPPAVKFSSIVGSQGFMCGLQALNDRIMCWGAWVDLPSSVPDGPFSEVAAGSGSVCGLRADGTGACSGPGLLPEGPLWFSDVPQSSPFFSDIGWLSDNGLTSGYADGTFGASGSMSRQAIAAFLWRLEGQPPVPPTAPSFIDVPANHSYNTAIRWMNHEGIGSGYPDGTFKPAGDVTRQALASFLWRLAGEPPASGSTFSDVSSNHEFKQAIAWMAEAEISTGYDDGTFRPGSNVSRQAMAAFVHRFHESRT